MVKETGTNRGTWGKEHRRKNQGKLSGKTGGCKPIRLCMCQHTLHSFIHLNKMRRIISCPAECFCTIRLQTTATASEPSVPCKVHAPYIHVHQNLNLTCNWKPSRGRSHLHPSALWMSCSWAYTGTHIYLPPKATSGGKSEAKKEVTLWIKMFFAYKTHDSCWPASRSPET